MWLKSFLNIIIIIHFIIALEVGDKCVPSEDVVAGRCTLVTDCEVAIRLIKNKNYNLITRCGFVGDVEVVCCPSASNKSGDTINNNNTTTTTTTTNQRLSERIADRECQKIIKSSIPPRSFNIIGGELASLGEFPHMVALGYDRGNGYEFECGGSLISDSFVLTAAHCVDTLDRIEPSVARMGLVELTGNQWNDQYDVRVAEIIKHPQYTRREKYHDLALIRLQRPVTFDSNLNAACLYTGTDDPQIPLTITGWGTTSTVTYAKSSYLLKANVTVVGREQCAKSYATFRKLPRGITSEQLCAGDPDGLRDTCQGDSGGPLQGLTGGSRDDTQYRLVGVTSFGRGCGTPVPGVYTRLANYLDWIEAVVWKN